MYICLILDRKKHSGLREGKFEYLIIIMVYPIDVTHYKYVTHYK